VEEAMQALGLPAPLCDAACEVVADAHGDCVDGSVLPSALAVAGVTPVDALRVYAALVKVRVEGVQRSALSLAAGAPLRTPRVCVLVCACVQPVYAEGVVHPCALVDAMMGCSLAGEVVEATARKLLSSPT
jgi:hypothetical protein